MHNVLRLKVWATSYLHHLCVSRGFPGGSDSIKKNLPAMQETWVQSLGQEDPLEKEMVTHFSILA